eukprot:3011860-Rhodomonas_salina.1
MSREPRCLPTRCPANSLRDAREMSQTLSLALKMGNEALEKTYSNGLIIVDAVDKLEFVPVSALCTKQSVALYRAVCT